MWEGDPVGVDPKRPLVGFALVAVLCAVLMSLSLGRGWSFDLFQPGKPITSSMGDRVEWMPASAPDVAEPVEVGFPVELSTQPLAAPARQVAAHEAVGRTAAEKAATLDVRRGAVAHPHSGHREGGWTTAHGRVVRDTPGQR